MPSILTCAVAASADETCAVLVPLLITLTLPLTGTP